MRGHPVEVSAEVAELHRDAFVLDLHNDALTKLTHTGYDFTREHAPATFWNPLRLDLDVPRIRRGGIDALGCLMFAGFHVNRDRRFWRQLDCARRLATEHPDQIALARSAAEIRAARAAGRIALFLGVEGSYAVDDDVEAGVARLAEAGVRFLGPLWERDSAAGTSCRTAVAQDRGLSDVGRALVAACNARGILLDVAHASRKTFWDMVACSSTPVFSSHSGAAGVHAHPRNLDDEQIRAVAQKGGIVGVIFVAPYLVSRGIRDAADLPRLTEVLWRRGWREAALRKLLGENALRYFAAFA